MLDFAVIFGTSHPRVSLMIIKTCLIEGLLLLCPLFTDVQRVAQLVKNPPAIQGMPVRLLGREDLLGCPGGSAGKESACNAGDLGPMPGLERSP